MQRRRRIHCEHQVPTIDDKHHNRNTIAPRAARNGQGARMIAQPHGGRRGTKKRAQN